MNNEDVKNYHIQALKNDLLAQSAFFRVVDINLNID